MSGIVKGIKKVVKGVVGGAKKIVKGVKKIFKKIASSTIGKLALAAVVIYTGGVLMGAWGSGGPMSSIYGAWGGEAAAVGASEAAAVGASGTSGASALSSVASSMPAAAQAGGANIVAAETAALAGGGTAAAMGAAGDAAATQAVSGAASGGFLSSAGETLSNAASWMEKHKMATAMGFQGLSAALSPDEEDMLKLQEESRARRWASLDDLNGSRYGVKPSQSTLLDQTGKPWHERLRGGG